MCIFVVQFISMSTIILSIGSNTFAKTNIDKAKRMLSRLFPEITFTQPILTEPEEEKYSYLFRNILAKAETDMTPEEVIDKIKQTERAVGRSPKDKYQGKVIIDIDLIQYNDKILRPEDYGRNYVQQLLVLLQQQETTATTSSTTATVDSPADKDVLED
jgi:2-amino-4-hydroxy-6-hydroxymethyldihydropteridine diphosphokinase